MDSLPPRGVTLAFDTSGSACCAAVLADDAVMAECTEPMARGQAERLIPLLQDLLGAAGIGWSDVALIGVGIGPGNFTGIRISVAAARGLALSLECRAVGVSTFDALALGQPRPCLTVVPARRGSIHVQTHDNGPDRAPWSLSPDDVAAGALPDGLPDGVPICGEDADRVAALNGGRVLSPAAPRAVAIARIARTRAAGTVDRPRPMYLRAADAAPASDLPPAILRR